MAVAAANAIRNALRMASIDTLDDMKTREIEDAINIVEWGKWSRGGVPCGRPVKGGSPNISDEEALKIDRQVAKLPGKTKFVIMEMYIWNYGVNELASTLGISNRSVMAYRDQGLNIIYGALCVA